MSAAHAAVFAYAILSRLAYMLFVGWVLRREEREGAYTFRWFRRRAAIVMNHDAIAFIILCLATRNTVALPVSAAVALLVGAVLVIVGLGTKFWAARTLGSDAYYWRNFFEPTATRGPVFTGPYRFASNPMYTIGYLQTYGLAVILRSWPGLIAAVFAQVAILTFYYLVEKPHFQRLHAR